VGLTLSKTLVFNNPLGMHLRPASRLVKAAMGFSSQVNISNGDRSCNAKSIIGLMTLEAMPGDSLVIEIDGDDAVATMAAIEALFACNFEDD
jgi:phosphotransferase system HPr (HPr) family protein